MESTTWVKIDGTSTSVDDPDSSTVMSEGLITGYRSSDNFNITQRI
jgi:hypothetical protein